MMVSMGYILFPVLSLAYNSDIVFAETSVWDFELNGLSVNSSCTLDMVPKSLERFAEAVQQNFLWIHLNIVGANLTPTDEWSNLLDPYVVTWAEDVSYPLLKYPFDFDLLSLGILNSVTDDIKVDLNASDPGCAVEPGGHTAVFQIYQAFVKASQSNAVKNEKNKYGVICFPMKFDVTRADQFFGIQRQSAGYLCCDTNRHGEPKGNLVSMNEICYVIKQTWLLNIAMVLGFVAFCFFPFYIKYIAVGKSPLKPQPTEPEMSGYESFDGQEGEEIVWKQDGIISDDWMELNDNHGIGLLALVKSILCFNISSKVAARFRRLLFVVLSPCILYLRIALEYHYKRDILQAFVDKGVPLGYLAIPFGFQDSRKNWGSIMGGPYVFLLLYITSTCFLVCLPDSLGEALCAKAVYKRRGSTFLALDIVFLEEYGLQDGKSRIQGKTRFDKLHNIMMAQFYMLFSDKFWVLVLKTWLARGRFIVQLLFVRSKRTLGGYVISALLLPEVIGILITLMLLEGILVCIYYGLPVVFLFKTGLHSVIHLYVCKVTRLSRQSKSCSLWCLAWIVSITVTVGFIFLYCSACFTFSYFFVHSLITILQVITFTFIGIVVNPSRALVYVIAGSIILFYLTDCVLGFSRSYSDLSRRTILAVEKISTENKIAAVKDGILYVNDDTLDTSCNIKKIVINGLTQHDVSKSTVQHSTYGPCFSRILRYNNGIPAVPRKLFVFVSERHLPIRREVLDSLVKIILVGCFLELSAYVISHFGKKSNLPLGVQVVATLFTGLIPKLVQFFKTSLVLSKSEENLQRRLPFTIEEFMEQEKSCRQPDVPV